MAVTLEVALNHSQPFQTVCMVEIRTNATPAGVRALSPSVGKDDAMSHEPQRCEKESDVESDEPRQPDADARGDENLSAWPIIPGNIGSLDDVPDDLREEGVAIDDAEGT
jgi:hypothetical protein